MRVTISSTIDVENPSDGLKQYAKSNLVLKNPEYDKKIRMGLWIGKTPREICLYEVLGDTWRFPFGCLSDILPYLTCPKTLDIAHPAGIAVDADLKLYDYQKDAVNAMFDAYTGVLKSKAGSGKTQIALELIRRTGVPTLWVTHTKDLLNQSLKRAKEFFPKELLGTITEGRVNVGKFITFATVQTLAKLDLSKYKHQWGCIVVDECHRVCGSPTTVTMFSKVLNSLAAGHKYGLTATDHRADGLETAMHALIGVVKYEVPDDAVADKVVPITVNRVMTGYEPSEECRNPDGTVSYTNMITDLAGCRYRNFIIHDLIVQAMSEGKSVLVLSSRLSQLSILRNMLFESSEYRVGMITGKMVSKKDKAQREEIIEQMRTGDLRCLLASYQLAKEGLDIPRLEVLIMGTPEKDEAVIIQSIGRVGRTFKNKERGVVYDLVDNHGITVKSYKSRRRIYKKEGCELIED